MASAGIFEDLPVDRTTNPDTVFVITSNGTVTFLPAQSPDRTPEQNHLMDRYELLRAATHFHTKLRELAVQLAAAQDEARAAQASLAAARTLLLEQELRMNRARAELGHETRTTYLDDLARVQAEHTALKTHLWVLTGAPALQPPTPPPSPPPTEPQEVPESAEI